MLPPVPSMSPLDWIVASPGSTSSRESRCLLEPFREPTIIETRRAELLETRRAERVSELRASPTELRIEPIATEKLLDWRVRV